MEIQLDRGPRYIILIDEQDAYLLNDYLISTMKTQQGYTRYVILRDKITRKYVTLLHRKILNAPDGLEVDHRNGNGLDCQRHNIRIATTSQNQFNRRNLDGHIKGVTYRKDRHIWQARITVNGKVIVLGCFGDKSEAIEIRKAAEIKHFGEFNGLGTSSVEY